MILYLAQRGNYAPRRSTANSGKSGTRPLHTAKHTRLASRHNVLTSLESAYAELSPHSYRLLRCLYSHYQLDCRFLSSSIASCDLRQVQPPDGDNSTSKWQTASVSMSAMWTVELVNWKLVGYSQNFPTEIARLSDGSARNLCSRYLPMESVLDELRAQRCFFRGILASSLSWASHRRSLSHGRPYSQH